MNKAKEFSKIMEISDTQRVIILTNHYQISGNVYDYDDSTREAFVNLTNASMCLINDVYETGSCESYTSSHYDWLHVSFDKIVAFSFINA